MYAIIGNKKLFPSNVSITPTRFLKTINLNDAYYEFTKINEFSYPLELALVQISSLNKYDLILIENSDKDSFFCIFHKEPMRKSILIDKLKIKQQLIRYKEIYKSIAIINNIDILNENINDIENIDFIAIEKLPELIDPNKKRVTIRMYFYAFFIMTMIWLFIKFQINNKLTELETYKQQLTTEITLFNDLTEKSKNQMMPLIPNDELKAQQLKHLFSQIDNGEIK